jgi:hypothetical protein
VKVLLRRGPQGRIHHLPSQPPFTSSPPSASSPLSSPGKERTYPLDKETGKGPAHCAVPKLHRPSPACVLSFGTVQGNSQGVPGATCERMLHGPGGLKMQRMSGRFQHPKDPRCLAGLDGDWGGVEGRRGEGEGSAWSGGRVGGRVVQVLCRAYRKGMEGTSPHLTSPS